MPKKYEDEIREILRGMDDVPGDGPRRRARRRPRMPSLGLSNLQLDSHRLMGGALILILFAWIMRGPWSGGFPLINQWAGYVSLAGTVLFIVAIVAMLRARGTFAAMGPREKRWRGQVIYLPGSEPWHLRLRRSIARLFGRGPRGTGSGGGRRGRDSYQW